MSSTIPRPPSQKAYDAAAAAYLRSLPLEHFMEATPQATQRKITLESFDLIHDSRPDIHCFNELLVQYPRHGTEELGQVVPDNMVVICQETIHALGSYAVPLQPAAPFLILEYVSKNSARKDYQDNMHRYEQELKVSYYLLFHPEKQRLTLYHHDGTKYQMVEPDAAGRLPIPEMDVAVELREGWVRFWYQGELVPLPVDMRRELEEKNQQLHAALKEIERLRAQLGARQEPS